MSTSWIRFGLDLTQVMFIGWKKQLDKSAKFFSPPDLFSIIYNKWNQTKSLTLFRCPDSNSGQQLFIFIYALQDGFHLIFHSNDWLTTIFCLFLWVWITVYSLHEPFRSVSGHSLQVMVKLFLRQRSPICLDYVQLGFCPKQWRYFESNSLVTSSITFLQRIWIWCLSKHVTKLCHPAMPFIIFVMDQDFMWYDIKCATEVRVKWYILKRYLWDQNSFICFSYVFKHACSD